MMWQRFMVGSWQSKIFAPTLASLGFITYYLREESNLTSAVVFCEEASTRLFAFGAGTLGQLGLVTQKDIFHPSLVGFFNDIQEDPISVDCSGDKSLILTRSGRVFFFGTGFITSELYHTLPVEVNIDEPVTQVAIGSTHAAALTLSGKLYTWGDGYFGQLGVYSATESDKASEYPTLVEGRFVQVACGNKFTCGIDAEGNALSWGNGREGALGHGGHQREHFPKVLNFFKEKGIKLAQVACGKDFSIFLTREGSLYSCGSNDYGQLGIGYSANSRTQSTPKRIECVRNEKVISVSTGDYHVAALTSDGRVFMFGLGKDGQLGQNSRDSIVHPKVVEGLKNISVSKIKCGGGHSAVVDSRGNLFLWGRGRNGQLGIGKEISSVAAYKTAPTLVKGVEGVIDVSCGADHTLVICL